MDAILDGVRIFYQPVGSDQNYPLIVMHGGPGLDHTEMHPWLDPLSDTFHLLYMDLRGQGRSERVDPTTLTLETFAGDVGRLADALGLERYAVLGHSFGAFVALAHAVECGLPALNLKGTATHYIISSGSASMSKSMPEIEANLAAFEPVELREQVTQSWALEPEVKTQEDAARLMEMQMPFHFARVDSEGHRRYQEHGDQVIYAPEVLAHFSEAGYSIEYEEANAHPDRRIRSHLHPTGCPRSACRHSRQRTGGHSRRRAHDLYRAAGNLF
jgi:pimeloyl-ACP methyl ester carboxylesterase